MKNQNDLKKEKKLQKTAKNVLKVKPVHANIRYVNDNMQMMICKWRIVNLAKHERPNDLCHSQILFGQLQVSGSFGLNGRLLELGLSLLEERGLLFGSAVHHRHWHPKNKKHESHFKWMSHDTSQILTLDKLPDHNAASRWAKRISLELMSMS